MKIIPRKVFCAILVALCTAVLFLAITQFTTAGLASVGWHELASIGWNG
jgi:hypothetical protein